MEHHFSYFFTLGGLRLLLPLLPALCQPGKYFLRTKSNKLSSKTIIFPTFSPSFFPRPLTCASSSWARTSGGTTQDCRCQNQIRSSQFPVTKQAIEFKNIPPGQLPLRLLRVDLVQPEGRSPQASPPPMAGVVLRPKRGLLERRGESDFLHKLTQNYVFTCLYIVKTLLLHSGQFISKFEKVLFKVYKAILYWSFLFPIESSKTCKHFVCQMFCTDCS